MEAKTGNFNSGDGGQVGLHKSYLMTPLLPTSASELLTSSTSVPVGASSVMLVWKAEAANTGALSLTSLTKTVTVHVPLREGTPGNGEREREKSRGLVQLLVLTDVRRGRDLSNMTRHLL